MSLVNEDDNERKTSENFWSEAGHAEKLGTKFLIELIGRFYYRKPVILLV